MSYREHAPYGSVVVCDCCGKVGAIGDRDWRQVRGSSVHDAYAFVPGVSSASGMV
jgi:hypothetical protein